MIDRCKPAITTALFADRAEMEDAAAAFVAGNLFQGVMARGSASLVVTGGRTPGGIYDRLAQTRLDWARIVVTLSDERWVAPNHDASNENLVRSRLLRGAAAAARFTPLMSDAGTPEACTADADRALAQLRWPMDLVCLGMGEDGHIASLFPGNPSLAAGLDRKTCAYCIAVPAGTPAPVQPRLSLTLNALIDSRAILIVGTGETKRRVFEEAHTGVASAPPIAALLRRSRAPVCFFWAP